MEKVELKQNYEEDLKIIKDKLNYLQSMVASLKANQDSTDAVIDAWSPVVEMLAQELSKNEMKNRFIPISEIQPATVDSILLEIQDRMDGIENLSNSHVSLARYDALRSLVIWIEKRIPK